LLNGTRRIAFLNELYIKRRFYVFESYSLSNSMTGENYIQDRFPVFKDTWKFFMFIEKDFSLGLNAGQVLAVILSSIIRVFGNLAGQFFNFWNPAELGSEPKNHIAFRVSLNFQN
tara:strand:- start:69 stop:413 length:345 start_codon:yes stop_codon:yes gene_type:complete